MLFQGVGWCCIQIVIDVYLIRLAVEDADTQPVSIAEVDNLDKGIGTGVALQISEVLCILKSILLWKLVLQQSLYSSDMLL